MEKTAIVYNAKIILRVNSARLLFKPNFLKAFSLFNLKYFRLNLKKSILILLKEVADVVKVIAKKIIVNVSELVLIVISSVNVFNV